VQVAVYPGSFDPVTKGHLEIIKRASKICGRLIVAVVDNPNKQAMFTLKERLELLEHSVSALDNVEIDIFEGLLINYVKEKQVSIIIKGLRAVSDFEYEFQMALMNKSICGEIETLFMMTSPEYSFLSSSMVKEVVILGGRVDDFVTPFVHEKIMEKIGNEGKA
jgi:pantetheine-phosphate adenylyltransferase